MRHCHETIYLTLAMPPCRSMIVEMMRTMRRRAATSLDTRRRILECNGRSKGSGQRDRHNKSKQWEVDERESFEEAYRAMKTRCSKEKNVSVTDVARARAHHQSRSLSRPTQGPTWSLRVSRSWIQRRGGAQQES